MMRIWKLTPTNSSDPIWKKWTPEPIIVRAESEGRARHLAVLNTIRTFPTVPGLPIPINPWSGHKKKGDPAPRPTLCQDITGLSDEYSSDGPEAVLHHGEKF
jgi:hypothetical protein